MLSYLRHPSRLLRKKRGKMLKHAQGLDDYEDDDRYGVDSPYVDINLHSDNDDYSHNSATAKDQDEGSDDDETSQEWINGEPIPKTGRYLNVNQVELQPRLTEANFNGQFVLAYQFCDDRTYLDWLKLVPGMRVTDGQLVEGQKKPKTKKMDKFKLGWTKARTKVQPGKMTRRQMRQAALEMNQYCQIVQMIEKSRSRGQAKAADELGAFRYVQGHLEELDNGGHNVGPGRLIFIVGLDIKFVRVPGWLTEDWIGQYVSKVGQKAGTQVSLYLLHTLELMERLEKFIHYYRLDLDQLAEVGIVYNGLVRIDMLSELMELYYDFVQSTGQLQKIKNKVSDKEWLKMGLSDTFLNYGLDINWSVMHRPIGSDI